MHRIDGAGHVDHLFVAEDPATLRPPTEITPEIMNAFQEELATVIEWAGIVLAKGDNTQLKQAMLAKFAGLDVAATKAGVQGQTYTAFTTGGATGAFTLTPVPAIAAYAAGQRFRVKFHAVGNGADKINVGGLGDKNLKQYDNTGAKIAAVIAVNQLADIEFDGVDMVILDPLPPAVGVTSVNGAAGAVSVPETGVRQTVLGGPVDANGYPSFLPENSANLSITSQNIAAGIPLVVGSANGFGSSGAVDRIGKTTANLTWNGLAANSTNFLYVDVAADGTLTPGSTTLSPVYQAGGARSTVNGQATFNVVEMSMTVGNGAAAVHTYRVFVGEAITNAATVTSTVAYAYQGRYDSGWFSVGVNSTYAKNHNIGVADVNTTTWVNTTATDSGKYRADTSGGFTGTVSFSTGCFSQISSRNSINYLTGGNYIFSTIDSRVNWGTGYYRSIVNRGW